MGGEGERKSNKSIPCNIQREQWTELRQFRVVSWTGVGGGAPGCKRWTQKPAQSMEPCREQKQKIDLAIKVALIQKYHHGKDPFSSGFPPFVMYFPFAMPFLFSDRCCLSEKIVCYQRCTHLHPIGIIDPWEGVKESNCHGSLKSDTAGYNLGGGGSKIDNFWNKKKRSPKSTLLADNTRRLRTTKQTIGGGGGDQNNKSMTKRGYVVTWQNCHLIANIRSKASL